MLRLTYPQWATEYVFTPSGLVWRAVPCWQLTVEQLAAGVARRLERGNPVALMADLSDQARIIRDLTAPRT
uniref:Uncharacterized protein n=1 Tax=Nonomuraea gerenzanensis TaxID=93944 RepID=A0A1M4EML5_9ACTN|nr:hypothetical protein BN4615_P9596 [Nonomuraea gerenzanensis]